MIRFFYTFLIFWYLSCSLALAQSFKIEDFKKNFSKEEWFKANGSISVSGSYYGTNALYNTSPWNFAINGNVNFKLFELINIPFSINLTNSGINYTYPNLPNRYSIHPSYKWSTLHIGDISMQYSPYTLSGHQFTGIAVDLKPDNWDVSAMFGRMQRAVEYDSLNTLTSVPAAYKRLGVGAKIKYNHSKFYIGANTFLAKDDISSLNWQPDSLGITPMQNAAVAIEAGVSIIKDLQLSINYGFSLLDRDIRKTHIIPTEIYHAVKADISYSFLSHKVGIGYERIDPHYQTLGAYYFNNDLENITLQYAGAMWKDKITFSTIFGFERNDLTDTKNDKEMRLVASCQLDIKPIENLQFSAFYSNFQTHQRIKSQFDYINEYNEIENSDTLNFRQISHQATFSASYNFKTKEELLHNITLNSTYQKCNDEYISNSENFNQMLNAMVMYQLQLTPHNVSLNTSLNYTNNQTNNNITQYVGPVLGCNVSFLNKTLRLNTSVSFNQCFVNKLTDLFVGNLRLTLSYTLKEKHCFSLTGNGQLKYKNQDMTSTYLINSSINYSYTF